MAEVAATSPIEPLLHPEHTAALRRALELGYDSTSVSQALGLAGESALAQGDLVGAGRVLGGDGPTETLIRLFLLGRPVTGDAVARALAGCDLAPLYDAGLLRQPHGGTVLAGMDLRPYRELDGPDWWVLSDLGGDVRPGVLDAEHVLGIGSAATTLAQQTVRRPAGRALDLGTGCGVQSLHLARHCEAVVATDINLRALRISATNAAINGLELDLRAGSLTEPVRGERFDQIVCNPPFIVGPGFRADAGGFTYRDSGFAGDEVSRRLAGDLAPLLTPGGHAQFLANWQITSDQDWTDRVGGWVSESGCDVWVWQREVADPGEYVRLWLRDAGELPGTPTWTRKYDDWLDWFDSSGTLAVGMGMVSMRARDDGRTTITCEDVPQPIGQPSGDEVAAWFDRRALVEACGEDGVFGMVLQARPGLVLETRSLLDDVAGWVPALSQVRQSDGLRWEIEIDDAIARLVAACAQPVTLDTPTALLADVVGASQAEVRSAVAPILCDLVTRGYLIPR